MTCHMANPYWPGPLPALGLPAPSSCDEARQRCDGCGQPAPNSLPALSECVLQRVEECQHFDDGTGYCMWGGGCVSKTGKGYLIVVWHIWLWTQFQNTAIALFLCPPLSTEVRSFRKSGTLCFQLEVMVKVVFAWYMLAPGRPELWKPALLAEDKSRHLYLHQKTEHVSYKVLHNDQRPQVQTETESNWYCCCKWYSMLFAFESSELHRAKWTHNPYTSKRAACTFFCTCWDLKWTYYCINKLKVICWMLLQLLAVENQTLKPVLKHYYQTQKQSSSSHFEAEVKACSTEIYYDLSLQVNQNNFP